MQKKKLNTTNRFAYLTLLHLLILHLHEQLTFKSYLRLTGCAVQPTDKDITRLDSADSTEIVNSAGLGLRLNFHVCSNNFRGQ